ncbi:TPA: hypothetical protein DIV55_04595 [Patescibacteria group bacterium]|uniref:Glycosyltransferase RgtA/B/C/D-like domain-containing protein n=1 Tax=Candidatus Gottesmanbacteria bacterium GW2011_GWA1_43_11 TaxID=1618436 RepID=A0A0G1CE35_9BACT|nr:MAG: hypothetical protein UV59_C0035G0011 [Candidatus Gottesmanbacteria bacterium GW2011_GWA1_43_11]HCS78992.1 hypothetical protein [Patescibacteria group bacterium]
MISALIFWLFIFAFIFTSGYAVQLILSLHRDDRITNFGTALTIGIVVVTIFSLFVRSLGGAWWMVWSLLPFVFAIIFWKKPRLLAFPWLKTNELIILSLIIILVVLQCLTLWVPLKSTPDGLIVPALHDTMWNIAIIEELYHDFPPENPGFSGVALKNTHYLYHLFAAATQQITRIPIIPLYYYFLPALVSFLFGLGIYAVGTIATSDIRFHILTIIFGFLCGNVAYLAPLFLGSNFDWRGNTFFADQPFDQLTNPYTVFGFVLFLFGVYWWFQATKKQLQMRSLIAAVILLAVSYGFKSFAGVVALVAVMSTSLIVAILKQDKKYLLVSGLFLVIFIPLFFLTTTFGSVGLRWQPGWLLREMMTSADKLNLPYYADREDFYINTGNFLGLGKVKLIELGIYLIGNLGIRLVGLITLLSSLVFMLLKKRMHALLPVVLLTTFVVVTGLSLPLLFNLGASAHNIIQFTPYALLFFVFPTMFAIEKIGQRLHKFSPTLAITFVFICIALAIPVNIKNIIQKIHAQGELIPSTYLQAFAYLKNNTARTSIIAVDPARYSPAPIYLAALSERQMYLVEAGFAEQTGNDPTYRLQLTQKSFTDQRFTDLLASGVTHVFMLRSQIDAQKVKQLVPYLAVVFQNEEVIIFAARR